MSKHYRSSLDYLFSLQFFGIKLGLDNIRTLLERVGNPQQYMRIIHLAGTNGKGSTAAALAGIFHAAGIRAGLYTSPHLHQFTERIRIDTRQIVMAETAALVDELRPHAEELKATFFEVATAMALLSFYRHGVAWAVLETGMGGRLDATNCVTPDLCLISPIAMDHASYLGPTLAAVAAEKAGIFKPGVPIVSAPQKPVVEDVLREKADSLGCPFYRVDHDFKVTADSSAFSLRGEGCVLDNIRPRLAGRHQVRNLALAAAAVAVLNKQGPIVSSDALREGLESVVWPGRLEWFPERILLDGAHNEAGAEALAGYLREQGLAGLHLVLGCKADKQSTAILQTLLPFATTLYATRPPDVDAVDPAILVEQAHQTGVHAGRYETVTAALQTARAARRQNETILVAGSLFLVAAARAHLVSDKDNTAIVIS